MKTLKETPPEDHPGDPVEREARLRFLSGPMAKKRIREAFSSFCHRSYWNRL